MAVIGQLAAGVAHEINTPLSFVASNLDSLRDYLRDLCQLVESQRGYLQQLLAAEPRDWDLNRLQQQVDPMDLDSLLPDIEQLICDCSEGAERIRQIVADLSDFTYLNTAKGNRENNFRPENINQLLQKATNIASSEIKPKADIQLRLADLPVVVCHGGKIGQVFLNLLVNAAQAIPERGLIQVVTGEENGMVWIEVSDNDCGIPEALRERFSILFLPPKGSVGNRAWSSCGQGSGGYARGRNYCQQYRGLRYLF